MTHEYKNKKQCIFWVILSDSPKYLPKKVLQKSSAKVVRNNGGHLFALLTLRVKVFFYIEIPLFDGGFWNNEKFYVQNYGFKWPLKGQIKNFFYLKIYEEANALVLLKVNEVNFEGQCFFLIKPVFFPMDFERVGNFTSKIMVFEFFNNFQKV